MKRLYAPWRSSYAVDTAQTKKIKASEKECIFCTQIKQKKDAGFFILKRLKHCFIMLNKFPYNAGHLLVMPFAHKATLDKLSPAARTEIMEALTESTSILRKTLKTQGINIGLNQEKAAGAGIPSHLHFHVLPRWLGDTNFLPTIAETKQISFDLKKMYRLLKKAFDKNNKKVHSS